MSPRRKRSTSGAVGATLSADRPVRRAVSRRFAMVLTTICAITLLTRGLMLAEWWSKNPLVQQPIQDATVYWQWADDIAGGQLIGSAPFQSGPLYPYLLGAIRALGGGLLAVHVVQLLIHVLTVGLIGVIGARRFGARVGLGAAVLFVLLPDPAFYTGRILNGTVQVALVCALWYAALTAQERSGLRRWVLVGALVGLNCLANPPMMLVIVLLGPWVLVCSRGHPRGAGDARPPFATPWRPALATVLAALVVVLPATVHNYLACGEFIPVSAQAGLTFYHGNAPGAVGTYTRVAGVSPGRAMQNVDALTVYERQTGRRATWRATSRFFLGKGWQYLAADPGRAVALAARKLYWFLTGRNYDDIFVPGQEISAGLSGWLRLAPLPLAWIVLPAFVAAAAWLRRPWTYAPELVLLGVPLLVVTVFWYSPRYRLPAAPVIAVAAAWALGRAWPLAKRPAWSTAAIAALVLSVASGAINRIIKFDDPAAYAPQFQVNWAKALADLGRVEEAATHYRTALALDPTPAATESALGDTLRKLGQLDAALEHLRRAVAAEPDNPDHRNNLGIGLAAQGNAAAAARQFEHALRLRPSFPEARNNLGNTFLERGEFAVAVEHYRTALRLRPRYANASFNLGHALWSLGKLPEAAQAFRDTLGVDPDYQQAGEMLGQVRDAMRRSDGRPAPGAPSSVGSAETDLRP